jgi:hypothetical protein
MVSILELDDRNTMKDVMSASLSPATMVATGGHDYHLSFKFCESLLC